MQISDYIRKLNDSFADRILHSCMHIYLLIIDNVNVGTMVVASHFPCRISFVVLPSANSNGSAGIIASSY